MLEERTSEDRPTVTGARMAVAELEKLFPPDLVSVEDVIEGLASDFQHAARSADSIEESARVRPDDLQLQVSM
jgi:hypothetical protein